MNVLTPEEIGFSSERLGRIQAVMQAYIDEGKLAGLITMLIRRGATAHLECFGVMDREADKPIQVDTLFRIYSMTKPITSVAALMLYERGFFQLDDPVSRFIPAFRELQVYAGESDVGVKLVSLEREMTIRHLFTHTSGLIYGRPDGSPLEVMVWEATRKDTETGKSWLDRTLQEWIRILATLPLAHQPGSAWRYGLSTNVLGYLVELISGRSFDAFLQEEIFGPLGMVDTGFYVPQDKLHRLAAVYGPPEEKEGQTGRIELVDTPASSRFARPVAFLSGGGGLVSSLPDYARFAQMLLNGGELDGTRLLGRKTVELMTTNCLPPGQHPLDRPGYGFGLGVRVCTNLGQSGTLGSVGEYGWGGAADTQFWVDPKEELIGLFMTQFMPSGYYPISEQFKVLAYQALVD